MKRCREEDAPEVCLVLQSKHKIFLSHSGAQKDFVEQLCVDLEGRCCFPFFDKRPSSLPKGERFPELILKASKQCRLAVVVVSKEYFESKWPMLELNAFVQASMTSNSRLKILPLFFGLSVSEFCDQTRQERWFNLWDEWAKNDARINTSEFKAALKVMRSFNGIQFNQPLGEVEYRKSIVSNICKVVPPDNKWDDSHVQGRSNLCEVIQQRIQQCQLLDKCKVCVIGFYGMGGIGKTTMCKTLNNELLEEFDGKVCHIEFASNQSLEELLKEVLKHLTNTSQEYIQELKEGQCRRILHEDISWEQKTFLTVDNVWSDSKSIEQAKMYLQAPFYEGSVVMMTARSLSTLTHLGIDKSKCFKMPELCKDDARNLFLYHASSGKIFTTHEDKCAIDKCVERCYFWKSNKEGSHYLPLALKVLGMQLGCLENNPLDWVKSLPMVREFNYFLEENPVFSILRRNYDLLPTNYQSLFMDMALYTPDKTDNKSKILYLYNWGKNFEVDVIMWLSLVHKQKLKDIVIQVQYLKDKGLLEDVDFSSQKFSMHDLYREFAVMEAQGKLKSGGFESRRWVYEQTYPTDLERTPSGRCWENLIRVGVHDDDDAIQSLKEIEWRYCSNVGVLKLVGLEKIQGVLSLKGLKCLRSLELEGFERLDRLEGLEDLNNLTYFRWIHGNLDISIQEDRNTHLGQLPPSLKVLHVAKPGIREAVCLSADVFARCTNLCELELSGFRADDGLNFSNCTSLRSMKLARNQGLRSLLGLTAGLTSSLQSLEIFGFFDLRAASGLDHLVGLRHLELRGSYSLKKLPDLQRLTRLQVLTIDPGRFSKHIAEVPGLGSLRQLQKLRCCRLLLCKLPHFSGLVQLQYLDLFGDEILTSLEGIGDLPALRHLNLAHCKSLLRLPDLSKSTDLEELYLGGSGIVFEVEDLRMLVSLPKLRAVKARTWEDLGTELEFVRRKLLENPGAEISEFLGPLQSMKCCDKRDLKVLRPFEVSGYDLLDPVYDWRNLATLNSIAELAWRCTRGLPGCSTGLIDSPIKSTGASTSARSGDGKVRRYVRSRESCLKWTEELHQCFMRATESLGGPEKATPKAIWQAMNIRGLKIVHVKSHLTILKLERLRSSVCIHSWAYVLRSWHGAIQLLDDQLRMNEPLNCLTKDARWEPHVESEVEASWRSLTRGAIQQPNIILTIVDSAEALAHNLLMAMRERKLLEAGVSQSHGGERDTHDTIIADGPLELTMSIGVPETNPDVRSEILTLDLTEQLIRPHL